MFRTTYKHTVQLKLSTNQSSKARQAHISSHSAKTKAELVFCFEICGLKKQLEKKKREGKRETNNDQSRIKNERK